MSMSCPRCAAPLYPKERGVIAIAPCFECGGLWLGAEATRTVQAALDAEAGNTATQLEATAVDPAPEIHGGASLACPRCVKQMRRFRVGAVEVDRCPEHGTWYDRGELLSVQAHLAERLPRVELGGQVRPPPSPSPGAGSEPLEDAGPTYEELELAHEPTRGRARAEATRKLSLGMHRAEQAYRRRRKARLARDGRDPGSGEEGFFSSLFSGDEGDDDWRGWADEVDEEPPR